MEGARNENHAEVFLRHVSTGALLEALPIGVYACDEKGIIVHCNRRAVEIWGRAPEVGAPDERFCGAYRLFRTDGRALLHEETPMAAALRERRAFRNINVVIERPDGRRVTALVNIDPVFDENGAFRGAVNCFQDISEVERAHAYAARKERELEDTLSALPAAVYRTDAEGHIVFYNEAAVVLAGRRPEIGVDQWCISWRLYTKDGTPLPHNQCPMAVAIREQRPIVGEEILVEQPDGMRVPCLVYPTPLFDDNGQLMGAVNMLIDIGERKQAENSQRLLINELNHRVKNTLAMVQAIASQTLRRSRSPAEFVASLNGRIQAFARAHNMLVQAPSGIDLEDLVRDQVLFGSDVQGRVSLSGPSVFVEAPAALHLALVLYELGTNARKYGALSAPAGRILVGWSVLRRGGRLLHLTWKEEGGPPVAKPRGGGFGTMLIEKSMRTHGAEATFDYAKSGVTCTIRMPLPELHAAPAEMVGSPADTQTGGRPIEGWRVLVVEDEPLVSLDMESILEGLGCTVVGPAGTLEEAMELANAGGLDAALLDVNIHGAPMDDVAAALTRANVPFAFVTGYGREQLPASFRHAPLVAKPFSAAEVVACLEELGDKPEVTPLKRQSVSE